MAVRPSRETPAQQPVDLLAQAAAPVTAAPKRVSAAPQHARVERTGSRKPTDQIHVSKALAAGPPPTSDASPLARARNLTELGALIGNKAAFAAMDAYAAAGGGSVPKASEVQQLRAAWLKANDALRAGKPREALAQFETMGLPPSTGDDIDASALKTYLAFGAATFDVAKREWSVPGDNPRKQALDGEAYQAAVLADMQQHGVTPKLDSASIKAYYAALPPEQHADAQQRIIRASLVHAAAVSDRNDLDLPKLRDGFDTLMRSPRYGGRAIVDCEGFAAARLLTLPPGFSPIGLLAADPMDPQKTGHEVAVYRDPAGTEWIASNADEPRVRSAEALADAFKNVSTYRIDHVDGTSASAIIEAARDNAWTPIS